MGIYYIAESNFFIVAGGYTLCGVSVYNPRVQGWDNKDIEIQSLG